MSFNAFKYVEDLRNSGVPDKRAEAQICILHDVVESNPATKKDIRSLSKNLSLN